jgi:hypothetical protein
MINLSIDPKHFKQMRLLNISLFLFFTRPSDSSLFWHWWLLHVFTFTLIKRCKAGLVLMIITITALLVHLFLLIKIVITNWVFRFILYGTAGMIGPCTLNKCSQLTMREIRCCLTIFLYGSATNPGSQLVGLLSCQNPAIVMHISLMCGQSLFYGILSIYVPQIERLVNWGYWFGWRLVPW